MPALRGVLQNLLDENSKGGSQESLVKPNIPEVREAIKRIDEEGWEGVCLHCETEKISERRLKAVPWAKYCIRCQTEIDANSPRPNLQHLVTAAG